MLLRCATNPLASEANGLASSPLRRDSRTTAPRHLLIPVTFQRVSTSGAAEHFHLLSSFPKAPEHQ
jgi:hypothetical protein